MEAASNLKSWSPIKGGNFLADKELYNVVYYKTVI